MTPAPGRVPPLLLALVLGLVVAACRTTPQVRQPRPAPAWTLKDAHGVKVSSANFQGKVVVVNFWSDWCAPCRAEIPGFVALQEEFRERGLVVVGISVGGATPMALARITRELRINYLVLIADEKVQASFGGARPVPVTFVIDREGNMVARHNGFMPIAQLEAEIAPLLDR